MTDIFRFGSRVEAIHELPLQNLYNLLIYFALEKSFYKEYNLSNEA